MPSPYLDYYRRVAERMLPFVAGRRIAIEQQFPGSQSLVYRRHAGAKDGDSWIRIGSRAELESWARQYAVGIHAHILSETGEFWFAIDIDARDLPLEMARIAAEHSADVLSGQGLAPLIKFSGSNGFHLMWATREIRAAPEDELWELGRSVVRAVACEVERRLESDERAEPLRQAVGNGNALITTANADHEHASALLFDEFILKDNANFRVPYSVHPKTGLVAAPLTRTRLETFVPEDASPDAVSGDWSDPPLPTHGLESVRHALEAWHRDGC